MDVADPAGAVLLRMPDTESEWNDGRENDEIEMTKLEAMTPFAQLRRGRLMIK